ncbi:hypothetical protein T439DRAFT_321356 [Meredithblackwellia eburnea MCA 4105]
MSTVPSAHKWGEPLTKPIEELGVYLATLPDFAEGSKRLSIRPQHFAEVAPAFQSGWVVEAGAMFSSDHGADRKLTDMVGSWFLMREESIEKARERLSADIYATGGAWDMSKATIIPVAMGSPKSK